jgi:hypothetical protein
MPAGTDALLDRSLDALVRFVDTLAHFVAAEPAR